ncbi:hypothetical protein V1289_005959 [Bradyrhizobium sp. AZCC 2289]|jgi:hypothetical protein
MRGLDLRIHRLRESPCSMDCRVSDLKTRSALLPGNMSDYAALIR